MEFKTIIALAVGLIGGPYCLLASYFNWTSFFTSFPANIFVKLLSRKGARILYALLGGFLVYTGVMILLNL